MPSALTKADQNRAYAIRLKLAAGQEVSQEDCDWFHAREEDKERRGFAGKKAEPQAQGASAATSRKVSYTEEETKAVAVGTGDAASLAVQAMGPAWATKEEGRRLDYILNMGITALKQSVDTYKSMVDALLKERLQDAAVQRQLLESVRVHYVARAEAEGELVRMEAEQAAQERERQDEGLEGAALRAVLENFGGPKKTEK